MPNFSDPVFAPLSIIAPALLLIVLLALTMRSIILREKAMIRERRNSDEARAAYDSNWRNRTAA